MKAMETALATRSGFSARQLICHEARRADRLYRGVLGHEIEFLVSELQRCIDDNQAKVTNAFATMGYYRATRMMIKTARTITLTYLHCTHNAK